VHDPAAGLDGAQLALGQVLVGLGAVTERRVGGRRDDQPGRFVRGEDVGPRHVGEQGLEADDDGDADPVDLTEWGAAGRG
jgi:hypothetical protein